MGEHIVDGWILDVEQLFVSEAGVDDDVDAGILKVRDDLGAGRRLGEGFTSRERHAISMDIGAKQFGHHFGDRHTDSSTKRMGMRGVALTAVRAALEEGDTPESTSVHHRAVHDAGNPH